MSAHVRDAAAQAREAAARPRRDVRTSHLAIAIALASLPGFAIAQVATPRAGTGFEVRDAAGNLVLDTRESGAVSVPGVAGATPADRLACSDASTGALGSCLTGTLPGPTGAAGPVGPTGATGAAGSPGLPGTAGVQGPTGPIGPQGLQGATGARGIAGVPGAVGPTGPAGPAGNAGNAGATGSGGDAGGTGAAGRGITVHHARGTAGRLAVESNAPTVQPGVSVTFTLTQPSTVMMWASIGSRTTQTTTGLSAVVDMTLYLDGTPVPGASRFTTLNGTSSNVFGTGALTTARSMVAGTHTVELRTARVEGNVPIDIGGNGELDVNPGELTVLVMPP